MDDHRSEARDVESLIASQRTYYDTRAPDYGDQTRPPDRKGRDMMPDEVVRQLVDAFRPSGDVLELACGPGAFTRELVRHARSVTAVDASPRMLEINRERLGDARVMYVTADIFAWAPDRTYDGVFFGFWLSHVPPSALDDFFEIVRRSLAPGGRVAFVDEDDRAAWKDDDRTVIDGVPAARRTTADGRTFDIVKVFWRPDSLESRLRSSGWDVDVRRAGETYLYGEGRPRKC